MALTSYCSITACRTGTASRCFAGSKTCLLIGCVRLLERDARWLFGWGQEWTLDARRIRVVEHGTPLFIVGAYDFDAPPPWRSLEWLAQPVELPPMQFEEERS